MYGSKRGMKSAVHHRQGSLNGATELREWSGATRLCATSWPSNHTNRAGGRCRPRMDWEGMTMGSKIRIKEWCATMALKRRGAKLFRMETRDDRKLMLRALYWDWRRVSGSHREALYNALREMRIMADAHKARESVNKASAVLAMSLKPHQIPMKELMESPRLPSQSITRRIRS